MKDLKQILAGISFFDPLHPNELATLAAAGRVREYPCGSTIFRQGDAADCLYVVIAGEVKVTCEDGDLDLLISNLGEGEYFGEIALIDGGTRSATVTATTAVLLFLLERQAFLRIFTDTPPLLARLLEGLSRKVRSTTEKLFREELESRVRAAETATARQRAISHLVTGLAHELNTPLGVCTTTVSLISEWLGPQVSTPPPLDDLREAVALLQTNVARAASLLDAFSAISVEGLADAPETFALAEVIDDAVVCFRHQKARPDFTVAIRLPADPPPQWTGYRLQMTRILVYLLDNILAHAYPPRTSPRAEIRVERVNSGGTACYRLTIQDFGCGIPAAIQPRVFDAFFTQARGRGHKGLGLTIVHNIVTGPLRGRLSLVSEPGQGTEITITIPQRL